MSADTDRAFLREIGIADDGAERFSGGKDLDFVPGPGIITFASLQADMDRIGLRPSSRPRLIEPLAWVPGDINAARIPELLRAYWLRRVGELTREHFYRIGGGFNAGC